MQELILEKYWPISYRFLKEEFHQGYFPKISRGFFGSWFENYLTGTSQKIKFSIKDFFSKFNQHRRKLRISSHLLKKSLMENFIFFEVK